MRECEIREIGNVPPESRTLYFSGEQFLHEYLNPIDQVGCGPHLDIDCLCDVDVSKTAGMTWDKVPDALMNVETPEQLVLAGANVWLNLDLARGITFLPKWWDDPDAPEKLAQLKELLRQRKGARFIRQAMGVNRFDDHTLAAMRRAMGASTMSNKDRPLPREAILKLHEDGKTVIEMQRIFKEQMAYPPSGSRIYKVLKENNLKPHRGPQGRPPGYKLGCGMSYQEWRDKHGDS